MSSSLQTLPIELIYRILDHEDILTIIWSMRHLCPRIDETIDNYHRFQVSVIWIHLFTYSV
jgi:hypothetical protein